jgi:hypothetical protein
MGCPTKVHRLEKSSTNWVDLGLVINAMSYNLEFLSPVFSNIGIVGLLDPHSKRIG